MDGGAWWAAVHGVEKSRTRLSHSHYHLFTFKHPVMPASPHTGFLHHRQGWRARLRWAARFPHSCFLESWTPGSVAQDSDDCVDKWWRPLNFDGEVTTIDTKKSRYSWHLLCDICISLHDGFFGQLNLLCTSRQSGRTRGLTPPRRIPWASLVVQW